MSAAFPTENPTWDLDSVFEGGANSQAFVAEVESLEKEYEKLSIRLNSLSLPDAAPVSADVLEQWRIFFDAYFSAQSRLSQAISFSRAIAATHTDDSKALRMPSLTEDAQTASRALGVELQARFRGRKDEVFEGLLGDERFSSMQLWLKELRRDADQSMDPSLEALAVELNRDGLHAWGDLYSQTSSRLKVDVEVNGEIKTYSVGQAKNLLSHRSPKVRAEAYQKLREAWGDIAPICASAINAKVGGEKTLYTRRGGDCLTMPLHANRVQRETVDAIFEASAELRPLLVRYLKAKAKLLGKETLAWSDLRAPVGEDSEDTISYEKAQEFIVDQVGEFSPKIADFCKMALSNRWVEAEDRSGKAQGGYCSSLPVLKEVRIFMTYGGTSSSVATLAHELGHGYHYWVMKDLPRSEMSVPMGLAETASTLLEALVEQAALKNAEGDQLLKLLDDRLSRAMAFLVDIPARYELELAMHEHRSKGTLHEDLLRQLTRTAFEGTFGEGVESVDDLFWASKLHFFITQLPFYNFPYTFGYLFSRAVYKKSIEEGDAFVSRIDDLLRDTGRLTSEEVARKYMDADLGDRGFWKNAAAGLLEDVSTFEELVGQ